MKRQHALYCRFFPGLSGQLLIVGGNTTVDLYHDVEVLELEDDGGGPQTPCFKPSGFDLSDSFEAFGEFIGGVPIVCGGSLPQNDNRFD